MSLFITFEGGEGCGKSTQARWLYRRLTKMGYHAVLVHEPGGTALGERLSRLLKRRGNGDVRISPLAELLLFNACRAELVREVIRPALEKGGVVVGDRYADSTMAYQGYGRGLKPETVATVNRIGTGELLPDLTVLLDIPVEEGLARKAGRIDRFEAEGRDFHQRVREGYLQLARAEPQRWLVIDATRGREEIAGIIWEKVSRLLPRKSKAARG